MKSLGVSRPSCSTRVRSRWWSSERQGRWTLHADARPEATGQRPEANTSGDPGATLIDGVAIAKAVRADVARETAELKERGITPGLTVVIVGEDPASQSY